VWQQQQQQQQPHACVLLGCAQQVKRFFMQSVLQKEYGDKLSVNL
jgi:hypothetical protein